MPPAPSARCRPICAPSSPPRTGFPPSTRMSSRVRGRSRSGDTHEPPRHSPGASSVKITDIKVTTVTMPLEAPLRHSNGAHWGRFVRTVIEVETDEGITGLGEMGGGGESAALALAGLKSYLIGHDPFDLNRMRYAICNPMASLYNNRTQLHAALEFACLDIIGKKLGVPVYQLLGGRVRDEVGFASYLFYRYPDNESGDGEVRTVDQLVGHAQALTAKYGFTAHKLNPGVFNPEYQF